MTLSRRTRELLAVPLFVVGFPALCLWGVGVGLTIVGRTLWMIVHKICRDSTCTCEECRDFDPAFVRSHQPTPDAPEPPAAA